MILVCLKNPKEMCIRKSVIGDTGYQGIQKLHNKSELPKKED